MTKTCWLPPESHAGMFRNRVLPSTGMGCWLRPDFPADNKIRIGRLILLMIGAKLVKSGNRDMVRYSIHDTRTPALLLFYEFLDHLLSKKNRECKA
jgi:hypothetical protein